jgi:hypothetical protein
MRRTLMLTGDINFMNVTDPQVPFARVQATLRQADVLFGNLECCFYEPAAGHSVEREGFYAPLAAAQALVNSGYHAVGNANNVNYGEEAIRSSLARLDGLGVPPPSSPTRACVSASCNAHPSTGPPATKPPTPPLASPSSRDTPPTSRY